MCSALIMLQAAKVHRLCDSVDYKRAVLETLFNGKEALIRLPAFIHFSNVACSLTYKLTEVWYRSSWLMQYVHRIRRESDLYMRFRFLCKVSIAFPKLKAILLGHLWKIACIVAIIMIFSISLSNSLGHSLNYILLAELHWVGFWHYIQCWGDVTTWHN